MAMAGDDDTTKEIVIALVNTLMGLRDSDVATNSQILDAAMSTWVSLVLTLHEEEHTVAVLPGIQEDIYYRWKRRMASEGVGQTRQ